MQQWCELNEGFWGNEKDKLKQESQEHKTLIWKKIKNQIHLRTKYVY